jgi:4-alpha-glucanotransferase
MQKREGISVPLFSLHSSKSTGVGEFPDIALLAEWCASVGLSIVQLLPMNELGSVNCPYDSISSFALEPMFISFDDLPCEISKGMKAKIAALRKKYPAHSESVDYALKAEKQFLLWEIFVDGADVKDPAFRDFCDEQRYWLDDYAMFKEIKFFRGEKPWYDWEDGAKWRRLDDLLQFEAGHMQGLLFHKWVQWVAFRQFAAAKQKANDLGVLIKGDMPVLVSRDSADVWAHTRYFKLDRVAGAPPDMYAAKGQRWGMPVYDWAAIEKDAYAYVKAKMRYAENFYDMVRIDHVVGLFRIWSIAANEPEETQGLNGSFDPWDHRLWEEHGKKAIRAMIEGTDMLFCAEDLGVVPPECTKTLKEFALPGNDVQRWTKDWCTTHDFLPGSSFRTMSVAMLSTHDTSNWAAWWENEAGTVDGELFVRSVTEKGIDQFKAKNDLFDFARSRDGRLRWKKSVKNVAALKSALGRDEGDIGDIIGMYLNTYGEKEKLWAMLGMPGAMKEVCSKDLLAAAMRMNASSKAVFCVESLLDIMVLAGACSAEAAAHRINKPGTVGAHNWSLRMPLSLEAMKKCKANAFLKKLTADTGRA